MFKYTNAGKNGKRSVKQDEPFIDTLAGREPSSIVDFESLLQDVESLIRAEYNASPNAIRKVRGDWYEALIALGSISFANRNKTSYCLVSLPKVTSFKVHNLYKKEISDLVESLSVSVEDSADVSLISSNPDFAIVKKDIAANFPTTGFDLASLKGAYELYNLFAGKCELDDVLGYVSVKTSLKPDRRLQIPHEGSLMKALYRHIQTRQWIIGARGIKYYGITMSFNPADQKALKTVATHSIVDVLGKPESAVDKLFAANNGAALDKVLSEIIS